MALVPFIGGQEGTRGGLGWDIAALAALLALFVWRFWGLSAGAMPVGADNVYYCYPVFSLGREKAFPLWNPYECAGMAFDGNWQALPFYPPRLIFALFDVDKVYGAFTLFHYAVALAGAVLLFRRTMRLGAGGAFAGALVFALGPFIYGRVSNPILFYSSVWFPWVLMAAMETRRARERGASSAKWAVGLGLAMAMVAWAGSPHGVFYGWVMVGLCFVAPPPRPKTNPSDPSDPSDPSHSSPSPSSPSLLLALVFWAALVAPLLIRSFQTLPGTLRAETSFDDLVAGALPLRWLPLVFLGGMGTPEWTDRAVYPGLIATAFVAVSLLLPRRRELAFPAALCALGLLFALGRWGGLFYAIGALPGTRFLINPARALILFAMGSAMMTAIAVDRVGRDGRDGRNGGAGVLAFGGWRGLACGLMLIAAGVALALGLAARNGFSETMAAWLAPAYASAAIFRWSNLSANLAAAGALLVLVARGGVSRRFLYVAALGLMALDTGRFCQRVRIEFGSPDVVAPSSGVLEAQRLARSDPQARFFSYNPSALHVFFGDDRYGAAHATSRLPVLFRLPAIQGYDPMLPRSFAELVEAMAGRSPVEDRFRSVTPRQPDGRLLDLLGVRYVLGDAREQSLSRSPIVVDPGSSATLQVSGEEPWNGMGLVFVVDMGKGGSTQDRPQTVGAIRVEGAGGQEFRAPVYESGEAGRRPENGGAARYSEFEKWTDEGRRREFVSCHVSLDFSQPFAPRRISFASEKGSGARWIIQHVTWLSARNAGNLRKATGVDVWPPIWENPGALQRAWFVERVETIPRASERLKRLGDARFDFRKTAIVEGPFESPFGPAPDAAHTQRGSVRLIALGNDSGRWETEGEGGFLVISQQYDPGWQAKIDGQPARLWRADHCLMGLAAPPGRHVIDLLFRPSGLIAGLWIMGLAVGAACLILLWPLLRARATTPDKRRRGGGETTDSAEA